MDAQAWGFAPAFLQQLHLRRRHGRILQCLPSPCDMADREPYAIY
jgi:hypothetical protein